MRGAVNLGDYKSRSGSNRLPSPESAGRVHDGTECRPTQIGQTQESRRWQMQNEKAKWQNARFCPASAPKLGGTPPQRQRPHQPPIFIFHFASSQPTRSPPHSCSGGCAAALSAQNRWREQALPRGLISRAQPMARANTGREERCPSGCGDKPPRRREPGKTDRQRLPHRRTFSRSRISKPGPGISNGKKEGRTCKTGAQERKHTSPTPSARPMNKIMTSTI